MNKALSRASPQKQKDTKLAYCKQYGHFELRSFFGKRKCAQHGLESTTLNYLNTYLESRLKVFSPKINDTVSSDLVNCMVIHSDTVSSLGFIYGLNNVPEYACALLCFIFDQ